MEAGWLGLPGSHLDANFHLKKSVHMRSGPARLTEILLEFAGIPVKRAKKNAI